MLNVSEWATAGSSASTPGIYIHIPFCARKCTYCAFNTTDFDDRMSRAYAAAVGREIACWGRSLANAGHSTPAENKVRIDSIFFGGGTPSTVDPGLLADIMSACRRAFDVDAEAEITIEINPGSRLDDIARDWFGAGINRASIGVQSFIDAELAALSRTHTAADARNTYRSLRRAGFANISLDLIAGLPAQTLERWKFNLAEAMALRPEHLSLYLLEIKDGTQLQSQIVRGLAPEPDDDLAAAMYNHMCDATLEAFDHYEISNFARHPQPGKAPLQSRHNLKYWTGAAFYGMGCGAHSYDGAARWSNIKKTERYIESVIRSGFAIDERRELSSRDRAIEALFMGLRLSSGIGVSEFNERYGFDILGEYRASLERLEETGLINLDSDRLSLSRKGMLLSNEVFVEFV